MTERSTAPSSSSRRQPQAAFWLALIVCGASFEFAGRFFGERDNPLGLWISWAPLLVTLTAALITGAGALRLLRDLGTRKSSGEAGLGHLRTGALICGTGALMLGASFAAKTVIETML